MRCRGPAASPWLIQIDEIKDNQLIRFGLR